MEDKYKITVEPPADSTRNKGVFYETDTDMFHAVCRALEWLDRGDVKVTIELVKG